MYTQINYFQAELIRDSADMYAHVRTCTHAQQGRMLLTQKSRSVCTSASTTQLNMMVKMDRRRHVRPEKYLRVQTCVDMCKLLQTCVDICKRV